MKHQNQNGQEETKAAEMALLLAEAGADHDGRCRCDKLDALMYWADSAVHQHGGTSISGATYAHRTWGPWPREAAQIEMNLLNSGAVRMEYELNVASVTSYISAQRKGDQSVFDDREIDAINSTVRNYAHLGAEEVGRRVRGECAYQRSSNFAVVDLREQPDAPMTQIRGRGHRQVTIKSNAQDTAEMLREDFEVPAA